MNTQNMLKKYLQTKIEMRCKLMTDIKDKIEEATDNPEPVAEIAAHIIMPPTPLEIIAIISTLG